MKNRLKEKSNKKEKNPADNIIDPETDTDGYFKVSENLSTIPESIDDNEWFT